jgi:hypothetical protein
MIVGCLRRRSSFVAMSSATASFARAAMIATVLGAIDAC